MMMRGNGEMPQDIQNGGDNVNTKKSRKQAQENGNVQMPSANGTVNTENGEPPAMPNGEMPTGTRPEMQNGEAPSGSEPPMQPNNNSVLQSSSI